MKILNFKLLEKGVLKAKFDLELSSGLIIRDMTWFAQAAAEWLSFPSRPYESEGKTKYFPFIHFVDENKKLNFLKQAMESAKEHFKNHVPSQNMTIDNTPKQEEMPF